MKEKKIISCAAVLIPFVLSLVSVLTFSVPVLVVCVAVIFLEVALVPLFKGYENVWMFVITSVALIPTNTALSYLAVDSGFVFEATELFAFIVYAATVYFVLFSMEQILFGVIARFIRPVQKRTAFEE
ncbi:MAG: hypothetical protein IKB88_10515 [Clostridia bacterium]|nr:hypothetical protein [Clostridia bacterium]